MSDRDGVRVVRIDGIVRIADGGERVGARQLLEIYRLGDRLRASTVRLRAAMKPKRKG